jgi:hypothetical protein
MIAHQRNTGPRLNQRTAFLLRFLHLQRKQLVLRQGLVKRHRFVKVDIGAGRPLRKDFFAQSEKFVVL